MSFPRASAVLLLGLAAAMLAAAAGTAPAATLTDTFDTPHDYLSQGVAGTIWHGLRLTSPALVFAANASVSNAGVFTVSSANGFWEGAANTGFLLYRDVSGDFTAEVEIVGGNSLSHHDMGLMARVVMPGDAGPGEDYVASRHYLPALAPGFDAARSTDNDATINANLTDLQRYVQLERAGNTFHVRRRDSPTAPWTPVRSVIRADMAGLPVQVGIWQATFSTGTGTARFDNFSLSAATVPDPLNRIYYEAWDTNNVHRIWRCEEDGSGETRLFNDATNRYRPAVAPDGTRIAYTKYAAGTYWICVANADGGGEQHLATSTTAYGYRSVAWHPDGTKLLFVEATFNGTIGQPTSRDGYLYEINDDGTGQRLVLSDIDYDKHYASYSPDGGTIAVARNETGWYAWPQNLFVCLPDGSNLRKVSFHPNGELNKVFSCRFSPDGTRIVYQRGATYAGNPSLWVADPATSNNVQVVDATYGNTNPTFSRDGTRIYFSRFTGGLWQLASANADGTNVALLPLAATMNRSDPAQAQGSAAPPLTGYIRCVITPPMAVFFGARWRLTTGPDTDWHESGESCGPLVPVTGEGYRATFEPIEGWSVPPDQAGLNPPEGGTLEIGAAYDPHDGMVQVTGGTFQMGIASGAGGHAVTVGDFQIDMSEVTVGQFLTFCAATDRTAPPEPAWGWTDTELPIVNVTWNEAAAYAAWAGKRLPTEAEFEYAMRGGLADTRYPWGNTIEPVNANYGNAVGSPTPAGTYPLNSFDMYDVAGNVWEWCADWYQPVLTGPVTDPQGPAAGTEKCMRGGSWVSLPSRLRCASRFKLEPFCRYADVGFRCASDAPAIPPIVYAPAKDGPPAWWVAWYFGTTLTPGAAFDPTTDSDGDGAADGEEYTAGTDPTQAASALRVTAVSGTAALQPVIVRWPSVAGRSYAVERAVDPRGPFDRVANAIPATPPENTFEDEPPPSGTLFYRVVGH